MKHKHQNIHHIVFFLAGFLLLSACGNPLANPAERTGTLMLSVLSDPALSGKTLDAGIDLVISSYSVTLTNQGSLQTDSFSLTPLTLTSEVRTLLTGIWDVRVDALNAASQIVQTGTSTITISEGIAAHCTVGLARASGSGIVDLSLSWPAVVANASVNITYALRGATARTTASTVLSGTPPSRVDWDQTGLAAGYYVVNFQLLSGTTVVYESADVLRIAANQTTTANLTLTADRELSHLLHPEMVRIPSGTFNNGSAAVTVSTFWMAATEVTQAQWLALMGTNYSYGNLLLDGPARPSGGISWYQAVVFCNKMSLLEGRLPVYSIAGSTDPDLWDGLDDNIVTIPTSSSTAWDAVAMNRTANGYRLPTEAEWEYAARGGQSYVYSGSDTIGNVAWYSTNSYDPLISASYPRVAAGKAANGYGLYDMSGNVQEWCWDWYGTYPATAQTDPVGTASGSSRVLRGGSAGDNAEYCTVAYRNSAYPSTTGSYYGMRLVYGSPLVLTLEPASLSLMAGGAPVTLVASVVPTNAEYTLTWSSSNPAVATVANGVVTPLAGGSATITASDSANNISASCEVTVEADRTSGNIGDLRVVPGGSFNNGASSVTVDTFWMSETEITQGQYLSVMGVNPSWFVPANGADLDLTRPVEQVSWYDALVFCNTLSIREGRDPVYSIQNSTDPDLWDGVDDGVVSVPAAAAALWDAVTLDLSANGYRLPTEAEWQFAARGGSNAVTSLYAGGDTLADLGWYTDNSAATTHPVGAKAANALSIHDLSGNVAEWCSDWSADYPVTAQTNPTGASSGTARVIRGGDWQHGAEICAVAARSNSGPAARNSYTGFRVVRRSGTSAMADQIDFENSDLSLWTGNWSISTTNAHGGTKSLQSNTITHGGSTANSLVVEYSEAGSISFWYKTSSEGGCDFLRFYMDGTQVSGAAWAGTIGWTQATYQVTAGSHTFAWYYTKDGSVNAGSDCVWIDDITFVGANTGDGEGFVQIIPVADDAFTIAIRNADGTAVSSGTLAYGTNLALTAYSTTAVTAWEWYLGSTLVDSDATLDSVGSALQKGWYNLTLRGQRGTAWASAQYRFRVE